MVGNSHDYNDYKEDKLEEAVWLALSLVLVVLCGLMVLALTAPLLLQLIASLIWQ